MNYEPQIEWCRQWIPAFKEAHDKAETARREREANRERMSAYMQRKEAGCD